MTTIETAKKKSSNSANALFTFLTDMNNYEKLMPEGKIEKWQSNEEECEFTIKGMTRIGLKKEAESSISKIVISSFGKVPFSFKLDIYLEELSDQETEIYLVFNGDINPFMKLMVEKPLRNFFNMLVDNAAEMEL